MTYPDETEVDVRARLKAEEDKTLRDEMRAISTDLAGLRDGALLAALRELRGELAGIRACLDSLVAIEKQLSYYGGRLSAIEKRLATLIETMLDPRAPIG